MSSEITIYAFEEANNESASDFTTFDINEARDFARSNGYALVARIYEYADSELVEDYRPGHALDGTPLYSEEAQRLYDEHANTDIHTGDTYFEACPTCNPEGWWEVE